MIAGHSEPICLIDDLFDVKRDFGLEVEEMPHLWAALTDDFEAIASANRLKKLEPDVPVIIRDNLANMAVKFDGRRPKLFGTYDYVRDQLSRPDNKDYPFWDHIKVWRHRVFDARSPNHA